MREPQGDPSIAIPKFFHLILSPSKSLIVEVVELVQQIGFEVSCPCRINNLSDGQLGTGIKVFFGHTHTKNTRYRCYHHDILA